MGQFRLSLFSSVFLFSVFSGRNGAPLFTTKDTKYHEGASPESLGLGSLSFIDFYSVGERTNYFCGISCYESIRGDIFRDYRGGGYY